MIIRPDTFPTTGAFRRPVSLAFLTATIFALSMVSVNADPPAMPVTATDPPAEAAGSDFPSFPDVTLTPIEGAATETDYIRTMRGRAEELIAQGQQTADGWERAEFLLAAANLMLSFEIEPACTRKLLGLPRLTGDGVEDSYPFSTFERATARLAEARALLKQRQEENEVKGEPSAADSPRHAAIHRREAALTPFALALSEYLKEGGDPIVLASTARAAASGLAPLLEDDDPRLSGSAGFWQSCLRASEAGASAALSRLDLALADVKSADQPYAFFGRLLRCRLLAANGDWAAATALLLQIEERCQYWFIKPEPREDALRAVGLFRYQVLRDWHAQLSPTDRAQERSWCVDTAKRLLAERFDKEPRTVPRLSPAVPVLATPPAPAARAVGSPREAPRKND